MIILTRRYAASSLIVTSVVTANAKRATAAPVNEKITGVIPPLKQPSSMTCWATVATMMYSWKNNLSVSIEHALSVMGANYLAQYNSNQGLTAQDKPGFLLSAGLKSEAPQNYTTHGWSNLIRAHGPLWVTTAEGKQFSIHARVMIAIFGDGTGDGTTVVIIDPADGKIHTEKLSDFDKKFESVAKQDLGNGGELRPQVVHY